MKVRLSCLPGRLWVPFQRLTAEPEGGGPWRRSREPGPARAWRWWGSAV